MRPARLLLLLGFLALSLWSCKRDPCDVEGDPAPDYSKDDSWICRPGTTREDCGVDLSSTEVRADGTAAAVSFTANSSPRAACFYVYPTVDLSLAAGLHRDLTDAADQRKTTAAQAARLRSVCTLHAPLYRQVTIGTYTARDSVRTACFDAAHADVSAAFDQFLKDIGPDRPIVIVGHSQGGQNVSRLLRERFDDGGALSKRLVVAMPIGWAVATAPGKLTGGSYQTLPLCERRDQTGCVVAYRSYGAGQDLPAVNTELAEGEQIACVNPSGLDSNATGRMASAIFPSDSSLVSLPSSLSVGTPFVEYRDFFSARCVRDGTNAGLEISAAPLTGDARASPVDFGKLVLSGDLGTHVLDMQLAQRDLVAQVGEKIAAFAP